MKTLFALMLAILTWQGYSSAQNLVEPADRAVNGVKIRASASAQSAEKGILRPGERAEYLSEVPSWYRIRHGGTEGFVSKGWTTLTTAVDGIPATATPFDAYVVDVGTGLAVFVKGEDFTLVYDAGSNDDNAGNRFLDFLAKFAPEIQTIDHVIVSHPHFDHISMLTDLLASKDVDAVWESGAGYESCEYNKFLLQVEAKKPIYHTSLVDTGTHAVGFEKTCTNPPGSQATITFGPRLQTGTVPLGKNASMVFLSVDGEKRSDLNENSLVVMLKLGSTKILLPGDSGGGGRAAPTTPPALSSVEGALLACCVNDLPANILVLGHHGSKTSSRQAFINAVQARDYIVSSGPKKYSGVKLPDPEVLTLVTSMPEARVWRTDQDDEACATSTTKFGATNDGKAGGCSTVHIHIPGSSGPYDVTVE